MFDFFQFLESKGVFITAFIVLLIILYYFIREKIIIMKKDHDQAVDKINEIFERFDGQDQILRYIQHELGRRCAVDQCPNLADMNDVVHQNHKDMQNFRIEIRHQIEGLTQDACKNFDDLAKENKHVNEQLLGLVRSFLDRAINNVNKTAN